MKKFLSLLILSAMLLTSLAACSEKPAEDVTKDDGAQVENVDDAAASEEQTSAEEEAPAITPDVPEKDMEGKVFHVTTADWWSFKPLDVNDLVAEETTGEAFNDAIYDRNAYMLEKYNCTLEQRQIAPDTTQATIQSAVRADDGSMDFTFVKGQQLYAIMCAGLLMELDSIPYTNYDNPWWNQDSYESLSVLGHHLAIASDITTADEDATWIMTFNKNMIDELNLESPYTLVNNGTWTYDKLFQMANAAVKDVNSSGTADKDDRYGIVHTRETTFAMFASSGIRLASNANDTIEWTYKDEVSVTKMMNLLEKLYDQNVCWNEHERDGGTVSGQFKRDETLFYMTGTYMLQFFRDMESDYGLIPFPKYDESQAEYLSSTSGLFISLLGVPQCSKDLENLGIFLEEFAYYGSEYIAPIYFETLMERKYMRDEESVEMIKYIFDNVTYDFGNVTNLASTSEQLIWLTASYDTNIASFIAARTTSENTAIKALLKAIEKYYTPAE